MLDEQYVNQKIQELFQSNKKKIIYPKQQTIQQMISMMPPPRITKKILHKSIQQINYQLHDYLQQSSFQKTAQLNIISLIQYIQKLKHTVLPSSLLKVDLAIDAKILHKQKLFSGNSLNFCIKILSQKSFHPQGLLFEQAQQQWFQANPWFQYLPLKKTQNTILSYNLLKKHNLTKFKCSFQNDYLLNIDSKIVIQDLDQRAKCLAKLYMNYEKIEILQKKKLQQVPQNQIKKQQQIPVIEDIQMQIKLNSLIKYVQQKLNQKAYTLFINKQYQQAADYKKKLQNLHWRINNRQNIRQGFQTIIMFKNKHNL